MADVVTWSPEELGALHTASNLGVPETPTVLTASRETPGFYETAKAAFLRENFTIEALRQAGLRMDKQGSLADADPSWNPYTYMRDNWDQDRLKEFDIYARRGLFENTRNPEDVELKADQLRRERDMLKTLEEGSLIGGVVGSLAGAITDPVGWVPGLGALARARSMGTVSRMALAAGIGAGVPELGLQATQDLRTRTEGFLNVGIAAALGGGLGALAKVYNRAHVLNKDHPDNPLNPANLDKQPVGVRIPGVGEDIIGPRSVGAASTGVEALEAVPGLTKNIPGLNWLGEKITGATPIGRALQYSGAQTKRILTSMMDLGGVLTNTNRFGERLGFGGHSAEDIMTDLLVRRETLFVMGEKLIRDLNIEMGQGRTATFAGFRGRIDDARFSDVSRRILLNEWGEADSRALAEEFGADVAPMIEGRAKQYAEAIHATNAEFERELIEIGRLRDPARLRTLKDDLLNAKLELKEARDRAKSPEVMARGDVDDTAELALKVDQLQKSVDSELRKPAPMGRDYGHAQLWDPHSILARQEEFEDFLYEVLAKHPDEDWLVNNHGLTKAEFDELPNTPEGATKRASILREWAGDEFSYTLHRAQLRADVAESAEKLARDDLLLAYRELGLVSREIDRLSVSQARKVRDEYHARLNAERAGREALASEQAALTEAATAARTRSLERVEQLFDDGQLSPVNTPRLAAAEQRAVDIASELRRRDAELETMSARLEQANTRLREVEERVADLKSAKDDLANMLTKAKAEAKAVGKELRAARRALTKAEGATPLDEVVHEIKMNLVNRNKLPSSIMERIVPESGRVKSRRIILTAEQRRQAESAGFLRTDLAAILNNQYQDLAGYVGLHKGLDIGDGRTFDSWQAVEAAVTNEYADLLKAATGKPNVIQKLQDEQRKALKDVRMLKDRLLGMENVGADRDGWVHWLSSKARQLNLVRFMAGFLLPSLTDVASVHLRTGGLARLLKEHGREAARIMMSLHSEHPSEFIAMVNAQEIGANGIRMAQVADVDDTLVHFGIGPRGSATHRFTSTVDRAGRWLTEKGNVISGMRAWNRFWKISAGIHRAYQLRDMVGRYESLPALERANLASLGIDSSAARRIHKMIERHGETDANGSWDPNLSDWTSTNEGREAARDFRIAVEKDMNRAIFTPGIGDTPLLMSHTAGKLWLQFQSFAFAFMHRFLMPASQRIATYKDTQAIVSFAHLAWVGLIVVMGKDIVSGKDPRDRFTEGKWADTTAEVLDRSGLMLYFSPYIDSAVKLSAPAQEAMFGDVKVGPTSRYSRNRFLDSALGANFGGLRNDIEAVGGAIASGDLEKIAKKGVMLAPFNTYLRLGQQLHSVLDD